MLHIQTILHPTDFSASADAALKHAIHWARLFGAELHLLHVLSAVGACDIEEVTEAPPEADDTMRAQRVRQMRRLIEASEASDLTVRYFLAHGPDPVDALLTHARTVSADLIMLGTRGLSTAIEAPYLGHVAAGVMQRSTCPVLLVEGVENGSNGLPVRRILVYIDFTQDICELLKLAGELARHFQAELDLLCVISSASAHAGDAPMSEEAAGLDEGTKKRLFQLCTKAGELEETALSHPLHAQFHVRAGYPPDALSTFAREHASDLLMMVAPGLSNAEYAPLEERAEHIVHQVFCPILLINPSGLPLMDHVYEGLALPTFRI